MEKPETLASAPPIYTDEDAAVLLGHYPSPPSTCNSLALPVCLPQTVSGYDSPFARAYNPVLAASGIEEADWLRFIDGLNIAITASPPLRVISTVAMGIGFIPYHWAIIAGATIQTAAQTAMHVLSKSLTDRYLRKGNAEYFVPRGLKVRLMKTEAMRKFVKIDADDGQTPSKVKQFAKAAGHAAESVALRLPIVGRIVSRIPSSTPTVDHHAPQDATHRRLEALQGYITPVSTNVAPPKKPESMMDQASELAIKLRQWQGRRSESKAMRQRRLLAVAQGREPPESIADLTTRRARKVQRRAHKGRFSAVQARRLRVDVAKADRQEYLSTEALVWIVLMNADQDVSIEGKEKVDDVEDVEYIDVDDWEEQLELEDEEDLEEVKYLSNVEASTSSQ